MVPSDGFQNVVELGGAQEREVDNLNMGKVCHEFHPNTHLAGEAEILQQYRHPCGREALAETNGKDDLGVHFLLNLIWCHLRDVVGGKGDGPFHHHDFLFRLVGGVNLIDTERFVPESEGSETKGIEERWTVG